ncbi:MAG: hypothetical protein COA44_15920 [Arcobacter sp.]|nr:MAG: hypothetical protein COA44_15920 [Arcobacter sp.]
MDKKELLKEIEGLLNEYADSSSINPSVLEFLEESDLIEIKKSLLESKKHHVDDTQWLEQFKKEI